MFYKDPNFYKQGLQFPTENGTFIAKNGEWANIEDGELIEVKTGFQNLIADNRNFIQFFILNNLPFVYVNYWLRVDNIQTYSYKDILSGNNLPIERITPGFWQNSWKCSIDQSTLTTGFLTLKAELAVTTRETAFNDTVITGGAIFFAKKKGS